METVCLIQQPAHVFTQATRGVDRLSSAVWKEAELRDQSPTHHGYRPLDADKAFPFYQTPHRENQSQKLQCGTEDLSDLMLQSG